MERLTIKELAPYVEHDIKGLLTPQKEIVTLTGIFVDKFGLHEVQINYNGCYALSRFKPLLRPLSYLTEEINWGNQTYAITDLFEIGDDGGYIYEYDHGNIKLISQLKTIAEYNYHHDINYLPYPVVQVLIEHHFDIFGLIDRGLALPIDGKEVQNG